MSARRFQPVDSRGRHTPQAAGEAVPGSESPDGSRNHNTSPLRRASLMQEPVLVLNATYEPINVCTLRRAAVLLLKEKAELLEQRNGDALHSEHVTLKRPDVIRLVNYVRIPREAHRRKITRRAVLARDSWTCQYCGSTKSGLTVDHVIPRSRGGTSTWENIVAACASCNRKKGNRMPREINMHPKNAPKPPAPTVFIQVASPKIPDNWQQYLPQAA